eukprot:scaffold21812_cov110-Isochrysis_galbana.AAC.2
MEIYTLGLRFLFYLAEAKRKTTLVQARPRGPAACERPSVEVQARHLCIGLAEVSQVLPHGSPFFRPRSRSRAPLTSRFGHTHKPSYSIRGGTPARP